MNVIKDFFTRDIPAVFSAGKMRLELASQKSHLGQLESQKKTLLNELGSQAWQARARDERYAVVYNKLEQLEQERLQVQGVIDNIQASINQEAAQLEQAKSAFSERFTTTQSQRQEAAQRLSQLQVSQKALEQRIAQLQSSASQAAANVQSLQSQVTQLQASTLPDKDQKIASLLDTINTVQAQALQAGPQIDSARAELQTNQDLQAPIKSEVDGYNQLMAMLQEQNRTSEAGIQGRLRGLQQELIKANEQKTGVTNRMSLLMPEMGGQVYLFRPINEALSPAYARLDQLENQALSLRNEINLTEARLSAVGSKPLVKVFGVAGVLLALIACIVISATLVVPRVSALLKPDARSQIKLVEYWSLENCGALGGGEYGELSIWENRRKDAIAFVTVETQLIGAKGVVLDESTQEIQIAPGGTAPAVFGLDPEGSRVDKVQREVSSVYFNETSLGRPADFEIDSYFEQPGGEEYVKLVLEVTNRSDFGMQAQNDASVLVVDKNNQLIDVQIDQVGWETIEIDSTQKLKFESIAASVFGADACLRDNYSDENLTFWYFVPFEYSTNSEDIFTISGKVNYSPK